MKKVFLLFIALCCSVALWAQVNLTTAGTLNTVLSATELSSVTNLTLTGFINAKDFRVMRDAMPVLASIDLSGATIVGYSGSLGTNGSLNQAYAANEVPIFALNGKAILTSIKLPSTTTGIGDDAFIGTKLTTITIPNKVSSIGAHAFQGTALTAVTIPASVTSIGNYAFCETSAAFTVDAANTVFLSDAGILYNKTKTALLQAPISIAGAFTVPNTVTTIGIGAFMNCTKLQAITLPATLTSIAKQAFYMCSGLSSLTIPASVTSIGEIAFSGSSASFTVNPSNLVYSSQDGVLYNKAKTELIQASTLLSGSFAVSNQVSSIGIGAFWNASNLTTIFLSSSVKTIGSKAFYNCTKLSSIYAYNPIPIAISSDIFTGIVASSILYVPFGAKASYSSNSGWSLFTTIKEIDVANNPTNKALDFDGVNDYVEVSYNASNNTSQFTVEVMFNCRSLSADYQSILTTRDYNCANNPCARGFAVYIDPNKHIAIWSNPNSGGDWSRFACTSPIINPNQWYHLAVTYNGSKKIVYLDGVLIGEESISYFPNTQRPLRIGAGATDTDPTFFFNGRIDEVRIWNTARKPEEIVANMYNSIANPASQKNLVAYYNFDQGVANGINTGITTLNNIKNNAANGTLNNFALAGTTSNFVPRNGLTAYYPLDGNANDYSGNGNNATLFNTPTTAADRTGATGKAYAFNGTNQYAALPASLLSSRNKFSVSLWINTKESGANGYTWNYPTIFGNEKAGGAVGDFMINSASGAVRMYSGLSNPDQSNAACVINDEKWHFVVATYDASSVKLYVDKVKYLEFPNTTLFTDEMTNYLMALNNNNTTVSSYHQGILDDVRVYDQPLSAADIADLYRETMPTLSVSTTNNALAFDGKDDYVQVTNNSGLDVSTELTMEAWINPANTTNSKIFGKTIEWSKGYMIAVVGGQLQVEFWDQSANYSCTGGNIPVGKWSHIAATWKTGGKIILYVNGEEVARTNASTLPLFSSGYNVRMGVAPWDLNQYYYSGLLDEVRIWSTARTQADIVASMNQSITATDNNLKVNYTFDKGTANGANSASLLDESGNNNNATLYNMERLAGNSISNYTYGAPLTYPTTTLPLALAKTLGSEGVARVTSTTTWTATSDATWLTLSPSTATGNGLLTIRAATANPTIAPRTATVTVSAAGTTPQTITVTQAAGDATLSVSTTNNALAFDGSDDYVSALISKSIIAPTGKMTIEAWVYWNPSAPTDVHFICGSDYENMELHTGGSAGANGLRFIPIKYHIYDAKNVLPVNQWTHIAASYDSVANVAHLYINGNEVALSVSNASGNVITNIQTFFIGQRADNSYRFKGKIDEFRLWKTSRSQADIIASMNQSLSSGTDLVASYSFNQGVPYGNNKPTVTSFTNSLSGGASATPNGFDMTGASSNIVPGAPLLNTSTTSTLALGKAAGSTGYASIASNRAWTANASASWLNVTPNSGSNNGELKIVATTANPNTTTRNATVVLTSGTNIHTITVTQEAGDALLSVSTTNNALDFDAGNYIDCGQQSLASFTIEAWINMDVIAEEQVIVSNINDYATNKSIEFRIEPTGVLLLHVLGANAVWTALNSNTVLSKGQWYHVAVTYDGANAKFYVNGNLDGKQAFADYNANALLTIQIGRRPCAAANFKGKMDELRIWKTARSQDSIIAYMNKTILQRNDLLLNYTFNQGIANGSNSTVNKVIDSSGNNNTGTLMGNFALSGISSNWTTGAPLNYTTNLTKIAITRQATTAYAEVTANTAWTATSDKSWLTPTVNATNGSLALAASANPTTNMRTAIVTITAGALTKLITFEQAGIPADDKSVDRCVMNTTSAAENYVEVPANPTAYNFADNNCTFEFWFKASDLNSRRELFSWKSSDSDDFGLFININKQLQVFLSTTGTNYLSATADSIDVNKWYHAAIVCAGTNLKVYLNGVAVIDKTVSSALSLKNLKNTLIKLGINNYSLKETFLGKFDEFRIWKTARIASEISDNMYSRLDSAETDLVGLFHFDEVTGSELFDYSKTYNHASLKGAVTRAASNAQITPLRVTLTPISACSIKARWQKMPLATSYKAEISTSANFASIDSAITKSTNDTLAIFGNRQANKQYYIRLTALRDKEGKQSDTIVATAITLPLPTFAVTQPTTTSLGSITVTSPTSGVKYGITNNPTSASNSITGLKRGNYPVYVKYDSDANCIVKAADSARINAKPLTATAVVEITKVYDGDTVAKIISSVLNNKESNDVVTVSARATYSDALVGKNKQITVKYYLIGKDTAYYVKPDDYIVNTGEITKRQLTPSFGIISKIYDGTNDATLTPQVTNKVNSDDVKIVINSATYNDKNVGTAKSVTVLADLQGKDIGNYSLSIPQTVTGKIDSAELTVQPKNVSIKNGSAIPALSCNYTGFVGGETENIVTKATINHTIKNNVSDSYILTASGAVAPNYKMKYLPGTFVVSDRFIPDVTINIPPTNTYGNIIGNALFSSTATYNNDPLAGAFTYSINGSDVTNTVLNAGSYSVKVKFSPQNTTDYDTVTQIINNLLIKKKSLDVTISNQTVKYGQAPLFTYSIDSSKLISKSVSIITGSPVFNNPSPAAVGTYDVSVSGLQSDNYDLNIIKGKFVVEKETLTVTAPTITMVQGEKIPDSTLTYNGFQYNQTIKNLDSIPFIAFTKDDSTVVGDHTISPQKGKSSNYIFSYVSGTLTVNAASIKSDSTTVQFAANTSPTDTLKITANTAWFIADSSKAKWIHIARKDNNLLLTAEANIVNKARNLSVVLSTIGGFASQTITVVQSAAILNTTAFTNLADSVEKIVKTASIGAGHLQYKAADTAALWSALRSLRIQFTKDSTQAMLTATAAKLNDSLSIFTRNQNYVSFTALRDSLAQIKTMLATLSIGTDACQYSTTVKTKLTTDSTAARDSIGKLGITVASVQVLIDTLAADSKGLLASRVGEAQKTGLQESITLANKYMTDSAGDYSTVNIQLLRTVLITANAIQNYQCALQHVVDSMQHALSDSIQSLITKKIIRLVVSEKKISYSAAEQKTSIQLTANHTWKVVTDNKTWLKVDTTANSSFESAKETLQWAGNKTLVVYAQSNTTEVERTAKITLTSGDSTKTIEVVQDANIVVIPREAITTNLNEIVPQCEYTSLFNYSGKSIITYSAQSGNADIVSVSSLSKGFKLLANTKGTVTITVTATTALGTQATTNFTVTVTTPVCALHLDSTITAVACAGANTGAIKATVTGGAVPYVYHWTGLPSSTSTIDKLIAGTYSLLVVDSLGCSLKHSFFVPEASAMHINERVSQSSCNTSNGLIALSVMGGTGAYSYFWDDASINDTLFNKAAGKYSVTVSDAASCKQTKTISINDLNAPVITIDSISSSLCKQKLGKIAISVKEGTTPYSYKWMDNEATEDRSGLLPGNYALTVSDAANCNAVVEVTIAVPAITPPQLALVTIDRASQKPLVVWLRERTNAIDYYTIYRDGQKIAERPYDSLSVYWDNDATIDTKSEAYSYTITASNACGTTTNKSYAFRTILLTRTRDAFDNKVITLNWDNYEGTNFDRSFSIYRQKDGKWDQWRKVINKNRVIDNDATGVTNYYVAVDLNDTIRPTLFKTDTGPFSQSMSNMSEASLVDLHDTKKADDTEVSLVPNPAKGNVTIKFAYSKVASITLVDLLGHQLFSTQGTGSVTIDCSGYTAGMYLVHIKIADETTTHRLMIE